MVDFLYLFFEFFHTSSRQIKLSFGTWLKQGKEHSCKEYFEICFQTKIFFTQLLGSTLQCTGFRQIKLSIGRWVKQGKERSCGQLSHRNSCRPPWWFSNWHPRQFNNNNHHRPYHDDDDDHHHEHGHHQEGCLSWAWSQFVFVTRSVTAHSVATYVWESSSSSSKSSSFGEGSQIDLNKRIKMYKYSLLLEAIDFKKFCLCNLFFLQVQPIWFE